VCDRYFILSSLFVIITILTKLIPTSFAAQCASLAREGVVYAAGSEDMDTLTFGGSILYRHLTFSEAKKAPIMEVNLEKALEGLDMDMSTVRILVVVILILISRFLASYPLLYDIFLHPNYCLSPAEHADWCFALYSTVHRPLYPARMRLP
jgi:hypothetical protein